MRKFIITVSLIFAFVIQMNPLTCAGEWVMAPMGGDSCGTSLFAANADPCHIPSDGAGDSADQCQCPCHVAFKTATLVQPIVPFCSSTNSPEHRSAHLPGFTGNIFRPPLSL